MENDEILAQDVEVQEESSTDSQESSEVNYQVLYEEEKRKANKLKRKLFTKNEDEPQKPIINNSDASKFERLELKVDGYNDQEVDFILKNGGKKALENPFITKAIEGIREQKRAENATVEEGSKSTTEKRFSPQEFSKLTAAEQEKVLSEL